MELFSLSTILLARTVVGASIASGRAGIDRLQLRHDGSSFISSLAFKHKLRVCNAYPYKLPMDVFLGKDKLTQEPLAYKSCDEFSQPLKAGDKLDFKVGDSTAGTFSVAELPNNDATLVLVIYLHDTSSTAVAFESHVFSNLVNAQIAVIDAFRGATKATPRIRDFSDAKTDRDEELRYDSVVAVNPGRYEVILQDSEGKVESKHELVALNRQSYIVVRCGVESQQGQSYPQDLIVYPHSDASVLMGAATPMHSLLAVVIAVLFLAVVS